MPVQTTRGTNIYFPDGAMVSVQTTAGGAFEDVGAINSAVTATYQWDESEIDTANYGKLAKNTRNHRIEGGFTLINLNPAVVQKMGGGLFEVVETPGTAVTTIPDQVILAGWDDNISYPLIAKKSSTDSTELKLTAIPTLTSVTLDAAVTKETLTENNDYIVVADSGSSSGYSIVFMSKNMTTLNPKTKAITIVYGTNTPVANTTIYAGSSTQTLSAYALRIAHTDDAGLVRKLDLYSVSPTTGGFQFNFKGANEDGVEEMPLTFTAKVDTSKTDGRQLMAWSVDAGAA